VKTSPVLLGGNLETGWLESVPYTKVPLLGYQWAASCTSHLVQNQ